MTGYTGSAITIVGLALIELPTRIMRLCDGGTCFFAGAFYTSSDAVFGTMAAIEAVEERLGDQAPGGRISFLPPATTSAETLMADYQNSRMRFWLGQIASDGKTVQNEELLADVLIDSTALRLDRGRRIWDVDYISRAEKLFLIKDGNSLSPRFHKTIWPGELGLDNATGLQRSVAWGTESPTRGVTALSGGGGGGLGNGGDYFTRNQEL